MEEDEKIDKVTHGARHLLLKIKSINFLDLFPDTITIDENKIDLAQNHFLKSQEVISIPIQHITLVSLSVAGDTATLYFDIKDFEKNPVIMQNFKASDAIRAKKIIIGLKVCFDESINIRKLEDGGNIVKKLEEIGSTHQ